MTDDHWDPAAALADENRVLARRLERERQIRRKAEEIAEQGLRDLYQKQQELEFLSQIAIMANQGGSVQEVLASALEYMCRFTGWSAAHAFILGVGDHYGEALTVRHLECMHDGDPRCLVEVSAA